MVALCASNSAEAQPAASKAGELREKLLRTALDNLPKALCGDGPCAPATPEELRTPPLTDPQVQTVISASIVSAMAEHCGLDWSKRNFAPMMQYHREQLKLSDRQVALVGLLHGVGMGVVGETVKKSPCTPETKDKVEQKLLVK